MEIEEHSLLVARIAQFPPDAQLISIFDTPQIFSGIQKSILFLVSNGVTPQQLQEIGLAKELILVSLSVPDASQQIPVADQSFHPPLSPIRKPDPLTHSNSSIQESVFFEDRKPKQKKNNRKKKKFIKERPASFIFTLSSDDEPEKTDNQKHSLKMKLELAEKELEMLKLKQKMAILRKKQSEKDMAQSGNNSDENIDTSSLKDSILFRINEIDEKLNSLNQEIQELTTEKEKLIEKVNSI